MRASLTFLAAVALAASAPARASGDAARGQALYQSRCAACHSIDVSMAGPAHRGVFGRRAGAVSDFAYSPALKASHLVWTARNLDLWLADPQKLVPGQAMNVRIADAAERADLIAYLKSQPAVPAPK